MPKKYQKPPNKNRRWTHNRPYFGQWWEFGKEHTKEKRKFMKGLRHKLLFHIPLTEEEKEIVEHSGLTENSALDRQGYIVTPHKWVTDESGNTVSIEISHQARTKKWRYLNPKEQRKLDSQNKQNKKK